VAEFRRFLERELQADGDEVVVLNLE